MKSLASYQVRKLSVANNGVKPHTDNNKQVADKTVKTYEYYICLFELLFQRGGYEFSLNLLVCGLNIYKANCHYQQYFTVKC